VPCSAEISFVTGYNLGAASPRLLS
jgi:hypothetical protein